MAALTIYGLIGFSGMGSPRGDSLTTCHGNEGTEVDSPDIQSLPINEAADTITLQVRSAVMDAIRDGRGHNLLVLPNFHDESFNPDPITAASKLFNKNINNDGEIQTGEMICLMPGDYRAIYLTRDGALLIEQLGSYVPEGLDLDVKDG